MTGTGRADRRAESPGGREVVRVRLPQHSYSIHVGPELLSGLSPLLEKVLAGPDILVIADARVFRLHGKALLSGLEGKWRTAVARVPPGEGMKTLSSASRLYEQCRKHRLGRDGAILAFGGGVTGDLAGFVAATWLRGVRLVMVPTTLLAQVDSSVGGKVGINAGGLKNMVGSFHQPSLVVSDTDLLRTLPAREFRSALAEVVKYGVIADPALLGILERSDPKRLGTDGRLLARIVAISCRIKAGIVARDERESGPREILNYGHTLGHALEAAAGGRLAHGEAVALGMRAAARISEELGLLAPGDRRRQDALLDRIGLPPAVKGVKAEQVLRNLRWDKKVRNSTPRFVLTAQLGSARFGQPVDSARVRRALAALLT